MLVWFCRHPGYLCIDPVVQYKVGTVSVQNGRWNMRAATLANSCPVRYDYSYFDFFSWTIRRFFLLIWELSSQLKNVRVEPRTSFKVSPWRWLMYVLFCCFLHLSEQLSILYGVKLDALAVARPVPYTTYYRALQIFGFLRFEHLMTRSARSARNNGPKVGIFNPFFTSLIGIWSVPLEFHFRSPRWYHEVPRYYWSQGYRKERRVCFRCATSWARIVGFVGLWLFPDDGAVRKWLLQDGEDFFQRDARRVVSGMMYSISRFRVSVLSNRQNTSTQKSRKQRGRWKRD